MRDHAFRPGRETAIRPLAVPRVGALLAALLMTGCSSAETLFSSNFDSTAVGQPPAQTQATGTLLLDGPAGCVQVVGPPTVPSAKWAQIRRSEPKSVCGMQANLSQFRGDGTYIFSADLLIPSGSGIATIQFEKFGQHVDTVDNFLHIDFMPTGQVRIDDQPGSVFGTFPHDQVFIVQVTLNIGAVPEAHIVLSGGGASGEASQTVLHQFVAMAHQFGACRIWMGSPSFGAFDATSVVVTKQ